MLKSCKFFLYRTKSGFCFVEILAVEADSWIIWSKVFEGWFSPPEDLVLSSWKLLEDFLCPPKGKKLLLGLWNLEDERVPDNGTQILRKSHLACFREYLFNIRVRTSSHFIVRKFPICHKLFFFSTCVNINCEKDHAVLRWVTFSIAFERRTSLFLKLHVYGL